MTIRTLILGACLILTSATAIAEVYKWTDETGKVHYGDRKPEDLAAEKVNVRVGLPSSPAVMAPEPPTAESPDEAKTEDESQTSGLTQAQRQSNCEIAQNNLKTMQNNGRIRIEENGERRYLTPEEIEAKRAEMQKVATENCMTAGARAQ